MISASLGHTNTMLSQMVTWPMAAGALLVGMFVYYRRVVVRPVELHAKEGGKLDHFLRRHLVILQEKYWPTFWCFESRLQTVLASMTRRMIPHIYYRREVLDHSKYSTQLKGEDCVIPRPSPLWPRWRVHAT